ncbi:DUF308 domain-containing protein [Lacticaseibacillus suihuaensis]
MQNVITNLRRTTALRAVVFIALGVWLVLAPAAAFAVVKYLITLGLLAMAGAAAIGALRRRSRGEATGLAWGRAAGYAIAALLVLVLLQTAVSLLPALVGLMLVLYGVQRIAGAKQRQQYVNTATWPSIVYGIIVVAAGVFLLFNPFHTILLMLRVLGITLIVMAVAECVTAWRAK